MRPQHLECTTLTWVRIHLNTNLLETMGAGVALSDCDNDGRLDSSQERRNSLTQRHRANSRKRSWRPDLTGGRAVCGKAAGKPMLTRHSNGNTPWPQIRKVFGALL